MGYNVIDLLNKIIKIAMKKKNIHENIEKRNDNKCCIKIMAKVLKEESEKTIEYYQKVKKEIVNEKFKNIDFVVYDKMSFLINEFNNKVYVLQVKNVKQYLAFSLDLEKDVYSLLVDLQGRFVKNIDDRDTITYKILSDVINKKKSYIRVFEKMLNK